MKIVLLNKKEIAIRESLVDGDGLRLVVFQAGCAIRCPDCQNKYSWSIENGVEYELEEIFEYICSKIDKSDYDGITFSGGDPLYQEEVLEKLINLLKDKYPNLNIWLYTGNVYENIQDKKILDNVDVLVDGPFIKELKGIYRFKGSSNQRILLLKKIRSKTH